MVHVGDRRLQPTIADASEQAHQIPDPPVGVHYLFMFISWFVYYAAFSGRPVSASSDFTCFLFHKRGRTHQSRLRLLGNPLRKRLPHCCKVPRLFTTSLALSAFHLSKRISLTVEFQIILNSFRRFRHPPSARPWFSHPNIGVPIDVNAKLYVTCSKKTFIVKYTWEFFSVL